jgi:hypothetical protein
MRTGKEVSPPADVADADVGCVRVVLYVSRWVHIFGCSSASLAAMPRNTANTFPTILCHRHTCYIQMVKTRGAGLLETYACAAGFALTSRRTAPLPQTSTEDSAGKACRVFRIQGSR